MKMSVGIIAMAAFLNLSGAYALDSPGAGEEPKPHQARPPVSGVILYGAHVMRHRLHEDGSATGHFSPPLPIDNRLLIGATQTLARAAFGQHGIEVNDAEALKLRLGSVTSVQDLDYEYQVVFEGTPKKGVGIILLRRKEIPHLDTDAELLKELETR